MLDEMEDEKRRLAALEVFMKDILKTSDFVPRQHLNYFQTFSVLLF